MHPPCSFTKDDVIDFPATGITGLPVRWTVEAVHQEDNDCLYVCSRTIPMLVAGSDEEMRTRRPIRESDYQRWLQSRPRLG